ncbi:MAG: flagellar export chaperone FliS [Natronospirillum sp.]|uniref:flagellar export chaperone FliS n=1 Tax=Natronospirillum sp. TaxID=2812955 RepID=UPI0025D3BFC3|nr:flagellar export chaperone FliS [Natronospirillum sp.]MCH8551265.1 flagellar export chaperone FliS [Natronospirillum sp.]
MYSRAAKQYQSVSTQTSVMDADPHRLIQLLIDGSLDRMAAAKGHIERNEIEQRNKMLNSAIKIISGLQESLNMDAGEIALNLERLYDYMTRRLFEANLKNDPEIVDEVMRLMTEIKTAWDGIREEALKEVAGGGQ